MAGVYAARAIGVAGFERLFAIKVLHAHLAHEEEFISMFAFTHSGRIEEYDCIRNPRAVW